MQEKNNWHRNGDCKQRGNWLKRQNVLAKKISAVISVACGSSRRMRRKANEMCNDKTKERKVLGDHRRQLALNKSPSIQVATKKKQPRKNDAKRGTTTVVSSSRLSGIFRKSTAGFNLKKWKSIKTRFANAKNGTTAKSTTKGIIGLKPSIHQWTAKIARKRDVGRGEKKKKTRDEAHEETNKELELCKKRILMGGKCRPLNLSGALHYDQHGILLPEDVITI